MASFTTLPDILLNILTELHLELYYDKFVEIGYNNIVFLSFITLEDLLEMGMKRLHARCVMTKINSSCESNSSTSAATGETKSNSDQMRLAPSVDPDEVDIDNLPIAHEVVSLGIVDTVGRSDSTSSSSSSFDFNSMEKEIREQMQVEFNARLEDARVRMEQEHIARITDERAAIKKEMELESSKAVAADVERSKREVATSTGETKEQSVLSESDIIARVEAAENKITKNYDNGWVYFGQMEGGNPHGYGTMTMADGHKYVGEWKNDKRDGNGTYTFASGQKYVGEYKDGVKNGQGTHTFADGTIAHSGEWVNDKPKKEMELESTKTVATAVERDKKEVTASMGETKEQSGISESDIIARVEAAGNKRTINYDSGNVYYGQREGGQRHGYGTFTWSNGTKYVGEWKNGQKHGQGTHTLVNGTIIYSGEWENGDPKI
jgi:hypothetical protein